MNSLTYKIRPLCQQPTMYLLDDFLTPNECEFLIATGSPNLRPSTVINNDTGQSDSTDYRTSSTTFFQIGQTPTVAAIENRIAHLSGFPIEHGENLQMVKYGVSEYYKPHYDYFDPAHPGSWAHIQNGGQRLMTVLMFLNDVEAGGETIFPDIGIKIIPKAGRAVAWWNCFTNGVIDPDSLHGSEPVIKGEKYIVTKWLHETPYQTR